MAHTAGQYAQLLVDAIAARIKAYRDTGDASKVLALQACQEVRQAWLAAGYALLDGDAPSEFDLLTVSGWLHWCRYQADPSLADDRAAALDHFHDMLLHTGGAEIIPAQARQEMDSVPREQWEGAALQVDRIGEGSELDAVDLELDLLRWRFETPNRRRMRIREFATYDALVGMLHARFDRSGDVMYLSEAIDRQRDALNRAPWRRRRLIRGLILSGLGTVLTMRFQHVGELADVNDAIETCAEAVATLPHRGGDHYRATALSTLGMALRARFDRLRHSEDLDAAVDASRAATALADTEGPQRRGVLGRAELLSNLGVALQVRFNEYEQEPDITEAIEVLRGAIGLLTAEDPELPGYRSNLGLALSGRFRITGAADDLDEAVRLFEAAVAGTPAEHADRVMYLSNLSSALQSRFGLSGRPSDGRRARDAANQGITVRSAPVSERIKAGLHWGRSAAAIGDWADAADGYAAAIDLLPSLIWRGINRTSRELLLHDWQYLANDGAACAIAAGDPERALRLLEAGRAVLWTQLLESRADLTALRRADAALAEQLLALRREMDATIDTDRRMALARAWDALIVRVRALPGLTDHASPPTLAELRGAVTDGAVVVVNVSRWRCDAIVLTCGSVNTVALPGLDLGGAVQRANEYLTELQIFEKVRRDEGVARIGLEQVHGRMLEWLWDNIAEPVLAACGHHRPPGQGRPPRIWWCPTGPLAILPLHAAGYHDPEAAAARTVLDRVVSSYTPTIRALAQARSAAPAPGAERLLLIALPRTPGRTDLPAVAAEQDVVRALLPDTQTELTGPGANHAGILEGLTSYRWVHAACHGTQDLADPNAAGLFPYDWQSAGLVTIADVTRADRPGGEFVFLSACKTATGGGNLNEIITLAAGLHYIGWRHVIGTLWAAWDNASADIARRLYPRIVTDGRLDAACAADALHDAVYACRQEYPYRPSRWVPFIHVGP